MDDVLNMLDIEQAPQRLFAIGDIHGCLDELEILLGFIEDEKEFGKDDLLVFIGDYVDRGPNSRGVIDRVLAFEADHPEETILLKGNHEDMFLGYLGYTGTLGASYLANGGNTCLESYDVSTGIPGEEAAKSIPDNHIDFLQRLVRYAIVGDFCFAHAGLSPLRDLRFQLDDDLFWIRDEFIGNVHYFQKTVIFGHTPFEDIMFHLPYKIGIDTGLVYGNALTAVELINHEVFQVELGGDGVFISDFESKGAVWPRI